MVALEAMERARPVIAAEIGGLGELVHDGETGLLVPPARPSRCARRSSGLPATSRSRREMGAAGRNRALRDFLEQRCIDRTEMLYGGALGLDSASS